MKSIFDVHKQADEFLHV